MLKDIRVTTDGKIGIGTTSPQDKLDVNGNVILRGNVKLPNLQENNGLNGGEIIIVDGNGNLTRGTGNFSEWIGNSIYQLDCGDISSDAPVWNNGYNKIFLRCPSVNVGIATISPRVNLDVRGTTYSNRLSLGSANPSEIGNKYFHLKTPNTISTNQKIFQIENNSAEIFSVKNNGLVQIGGLTQLIGIHSDALLTINGKVVCKALYVNMNNWADNVFDESYKMPKLKDIEAYYLLNKHLPDVPSEKEILENGLNVNEINVVFMRKIEELTILLVEQEKKLNTLSEELEKVRKN